MCIVVLDLSQKSKTSERSNFVPGNSSGGAWWIDVSRKGCWHCHFLLSLLINQRSRRTRSSTGISLHSSVDIPWPHASVAMPYLVMAMIDLITKKPSTSTSLLSQTKEMSMPNPHLYMPGLAMVMMRLIIARLMSLSVACGDFLRLSVLFDLVLGIPG